VEGEATVVGMRVQVHLNSTGGATATMVRTAKGLYCSANKENVMAKFPAAAATAEGWAAALGKCEAFCRTQVSCQACSVDCTAATTCGTAAPTVQWAALPTCGRHLTWKGTGAGDISEKSSVQSGDATITITGPSDKWFAVGFGAPNSLMSDMPYAIVVNSTSVTERKLGTCGSEADHCPGTLLAGSVTVVSSAVAGGRRTVVLARKFAGRTHAHYSFAPASVATIPLIGAIGSSEVFAYHAGHQAAKLTFTARGVPTCLCNDGGEGQICEAGGTQCRPFVKNCLSRADGGDLLAQKNPTCDAAHYSGGLSCCHHNRIMLDTDQRQKHSLDRDKLRYHMKFRFWFQEYVPSGAKAPPTGTSDNRSTASHFNLPRIYFQTEANAGEYDIPPAFPTKQDDFIPGYGSM
jgi:hypothetical protein